MNAPSEQERVAARSLVSPGLRAGDVGGAGSEHATPRQPAARRAAPPVRALRAELSRRKRLTLGVACFLAVVLGWEIAVRTGLIDGTYFPPPNLIFATLWDMIAHQNFMSDVGISVYRVSVAFGLSAVMAIPLGIVMSSYRSFGAAIEPIIDFIRYLPVPALVPLSIIWLGVGEETKLFLLWMGTFFQLILLVADDVLKVPQEYLEVAATVGAKPHQAMRDVILRAMLPSLVNNLRITLGWCWTYLIVAEIVASDSGIGFVIWSARRYMQTPQVMAGVVAIGIIGLATDQILRLVHRLMFRYL
jgi:NitT/TauT family transport system permease protein